MKRNEIKEMQYILNQMRKALIHKSDREKRNDKQKSTNKQS